VDFFMKPKESKEATRGYCPVAGSRVDS
jgi:hypothetical protein